MAFLAPKITNSILTAGCFFGLVATAGRYSRRPLRMAAHRPMTPSARVPRGQKLI